VEKTTFIIYIYIVQKQIDHQKVKFREDKVRKTWEARKRTEKQYEEQENKITHQTYIYIYIYISGLR
jgi:hypothetical protein